MRDDSSGVSTDEQGEWWGSKGLGTVPHALIAVYGGDTTVATLKFDEFINRAPESMGHLTAKGTPDGDVNVPARARGRGRGRRGPRRDAAAHLAAADGAGRRGLRARAHRGLGRLRRGEDP